MQQRFSHILNLLLAECVVCSAFLSETLSSRDSVEHSFNSDRPLNLQLIVWIIALHVFLHVTVWLCFILLCVWSWYSCFFLSWCRFSCSWSSWCSGCCGWWLFSFSERKRSYTGHRAQKYTSPQKVVKPCTTSDAEKRWWSFCHVAEQFSQLKPPKYRG